MLSQARFFYLHQKPKKKKSNQKKKPDGRLLL